MRKYLLYILSFICLVFFPLNVKAETLDELNNQLSEKTQEIESINNQITEKTEEIIGIEANLNSTKGLLDEQYKDMKLRIKYMYENSNENILESLIESENFSKFLNEVSLKSTMMNYDRTKLVKIQKTIEEMNQTQKTLNDEKEKLEKLKEENEEKKNNLEKMIEEKKEEIRKAAEQNSAVAQNIEKSNEAINSTTDITYTTANDFGYSDQQLDLICAIVAQECSTSYDGALAVITCAMNRCQSSQWMSRGTDPLSQLCARGQFCYSIDGRYRNRLNGNYESFVRQAVIDCLNGKRNHNFLSFRGYRKAGSVNIGDNWYFNEM